MLVVAAVSLVLLAGKVSGEGNLSCYQCTSKTPEQCPPETLLPCPPSKDRCVTHISKDAKNGYLLKRECGLGPCGFTDDMVNRGLGLDQCHTTKEEFFCVFCCTENGCNLAPNHSVSVFLILFVITLITFHSITI